MMVAPLPVGSVRTNAPTVMGLIETSLFKFTREQVVVFGAGRTDSGVHATGQVAHFDLERTGTAIRSARH